MLRGDDDGFDGEANGEEDYDADFDDATESGGWWAPQEGGTPSKKARPRGLLRARVRLVPPEGAPHRCHVVKLSLDSAQLAKSRGAIPRLGQLVEVELEATDVVFDGVVARATPDDRCFTVRFVDLDAVKRQVLTDLIAAIGDEQPPSPTSYTVTKKQ
jgi:hypothetical protein